MEAQLYSGQLQNQSGDSQVAGLQTLSNTLVNQVLIPSGILWHVL